MCLIFENIEPPEAMIVAPPSLDQASVFSMCFPKEVPDCDLPMDLGDGYDGVTLPDTYLDEMDMIDNGCILDTTPHRPHFAFEIFGVFFIDSDDVTLYDACIDEMDMIGIGRILDASPPKPRSAFDVLLLILLMILFLLRERSTLWTHLFLLTLCQGLSLALMTFLMVIMT